MRRLTLIVSLVALVVVSAAPALAGNGNERNFAASLSGDNEVPAVESSGHGEAVFHISKDGDSIDYKLIVANIDEVTQSHIHLGAAGTNGSVVVFLFGFVADGVTSNGVLAEGTITEADLIGPLAGMPLSALVEALSNGTAYVNVHTLDHPGGEIRGQVK